MIRRLIERVRSWGWGPETPPPPEVPVPRLGRFGSIEEAALRVMFATPIPAVWDGEGIK